MANINFVQTEMKLFLFLFLCVLNSQSTTFQIKTSLANNDGQDFKNDRSHINWIDAGFEDRCPQLRKEVMNRREIGDKIIQFCVRIPTKSQCRLFVYLWGFLDSEYEDVDRLFK